MRALINEADIQSLRETLKIVAANDETASARIGRILYKKKKEGAFAKAGGEAKEGEKKEVGENGRPIIFFDITIGKETVGRIKFEVFMF